MKETLYDRNEFKLIERVCKLRESNEKIKVSEIKRLDIQGEVYSVEVQS